MKLRKVKICGFRSLKHVSLDFRSDYNVIIGPNDIGKSSILHSLDMFYENRKPDLEDFHFGQKEISITMTFRLEEEERREIENDLVELGIILDDKGEFSITKSFNLDDESGRINTRTYIDGSETRRWKVIRDYLPQFVYIPSLRDINDATKVTTQSVFGKLISPLLSKANEEKRILEKKIEELIGNIRTDLEEFLKEQSPNISGIDMNTNIAVNKAIDIDFLISDIFSDNKTHISKRGSGLQNSLVVAIFRTYAKYGIGRNLIFGIEEPEAFLHLAAQRKFCSAIKDISNDTHGSQVILTTHSTVFIDRSDLTGLSLLKRDENGQVVVKRIKNETDLSEIKDSLDIRNSDLLLWDVIFFVEGPTEKKVLDIWAKKLGFDFDKLGINIIPMDGCSNSDYFANAKILDSFGIPYFILLDSDNKDPDEIKRKLLSNRHLKIKEEYIHILSKREIENYYSPRAIKEAYPNIDFDDLEINDVDDIKKKLEQKTHQKATTIGPKVARLMEAEEIDKEIKSIFERLKELAKEQR